MFTTQGCTTMVPNISLSRRPVHVFFYSFNGDCLVVAVAVIWCDVCSVCSAVPSSGSGDSCTSPAQSHWFLLKIIPLYVVDQSQQLIVLCTRWLLTVDQFLLIAVTLEKFSSMGSLLLKCVLWVPWKFLESYGVQICQKPEMTSPLNFAHIFEFSQ